MSFSDSYDTIRYEKATILQIKDYSNEHTGENRKEPASYTDIDPVEIPTSELDKIIDKYGKDIIDSDGFQSERRFLQHGNTSTFKHSIAVARNAVNMAFTMHLDVDMKSLVAAALLHDYFLYDWHVDAPWHRLHGLTHGKTAADNVRRDFPELANDVVIDSITNHMFPLTRTAPKHTEGWLVTAADKICATAETFNPHRFSSKFSIPVLKNIPVIPSSADPEAAAAFESEKDVNAGEDKNLNANRVARGFYEGVVAYRKETKKR